MFGYVHVERITMGFIFWWGWTYILKFNKYVFHIIREKMVSTLEKIQKGTGRLEMLRMREGESSFNFKSGNPGRSH